MLQRIGDALTRRKWLTYLLFGALAVIFAAWGAYGIATINFGGSTNAAKVDGETIPYDQVRQAWLEQQAEWQQRTGSDMPPAVKARMEDALLERFVRETLLDKRTHDLGYRVSESQIAEAIRSEPAFQLEGKYSPEVAKMRLQQAGISEQQFELDIRRGLRSAQLEDGIRETDFLTPAELERIQSLQNEQREVEYAVLPAEKFTSTDPIDEKSVQAYYEAHQLQFMTPEYVHLEYAELTQAQVAAQTQVSDLDLHDYYDKHKNRYVQAEQRRARQILIAVSKTRDDAAALKRANEVLAKLKAGGDFASLAKQYSDDAGSAAQGGDLGWTDRTTLASFAAPVADAVFSMKASELRGPVKSPFGYSVLELEGIQPGKTKTFDEARAQIETELRHDKSADRFGDIQEQIQQQLDEGSPTLASLAKQFGMQSGEVAEFVRGTGGGALGNSRELQDAAFGDPVLNEHRIGGPVIVNNDRMVLLRALDHHMPAPQPLAQVHDTIVAAIRKERASEAAVRAAQGAVRELEAGTAFEAVVHSLGVSADPAHDVGRTDPSIPAQIRSAVFESAKPAKGKPEYRALALSGGDAAVVGILGVKMASPLDNPQLLITTRQQEGSRYGAEATNSYLEQLRMSAKVEKNLQVFAQ